MKKALFLMMCLCFSISVLAQAKTVTGTVVDAIGEPIIGASVLEMGTTNGTITDVDGNFTLQVPEGYKTGSEFSWLQITANCGGRAEPLQGGVERRY